MKPYNRTLKYYFMKQQTTGIIVLSIIFLLTGCNHTKQSAPVTVSTAAKSTIDTSDYLTRVYDTDDESIGYGYINRKGDTVIAISKYTMCFTSKFKSFAIVIKDGDFVGIDRKENVLYKVFPFDNGPDEASDGLFRIIENNKIGYADAVTGAIVIKPQFDCAWPFEHGAARVSNDCKTEIEGEHSSWVSDHWYYIDRTGKKVKTPK